MRLNEMKARLINLKKIADPRGNLTTVEGGQDVPFSVSRVYWTYDVPAGECRGGHAHRRCEEFIIATGGSFCVTLDNGHEKQSYLLNHPYQGLYVGPGIWRTLTDFSSGAVCLVLASDPFEEADYIRDYNEFIAEIKKNDNSNV